MNKLKLELDLLNNRDWMEYDNIIYSNCAFIRSVVNGVNLITTTNNRKGVVVWEEIKKTVNNSGHYLILTSISGIADDGGFDLVEVERKENFVSWKFNDGSNWEWKFPKKEYDEEIKRLEKEIIKLDINIPLEPDNVVFPRYLKT